MSNIKNIYSKLKNFLTKPRNELKQDTILLKVIYAICHLFGLYIFLVLMFSIFMLDYIPEIGILKYFKDKVYEFILIFAPVILYIGFPSCLLYSSVQLSKFKHIFANLLNIIFLILLQIPFWIWFYKRLTSYTEYMEFYHDIWNRNEFFEANACKLYFIFSIIGFAFYLYKRCKDSKKFIALYLIIFACIGAPFAYLCYQNTQGVCLKTGKKLDDKQVIKDAINGYVKENLLYPNKFVLFLTKNTIFEKNPNYKNDDDKYYIYNYIGLLKKGNLLDINNLPKNVNKELTTDNFDKYIYEERKWIAFKKGLEKDYPYPNDNKDQLLKLEKNSRAFLPYASYEDFIKLNPDCCKFENSPSIYGQRRYIESKYKIFYYHEDEKKFYVSKYKANRDISNCEEQSVINRLFY